MQGVMAQRAGSDLALLRIREPHTPITASETSGYRALSQLRFPLAQRFGEKSNPPWLLRPNGALEVRAGPSLRGHPNRCGRATVKDPDTWTRRRGPRSPLNVMHL